MIPFVLNFRMQLVLLSLAFLFCMSFAKLTGRILTSQITGYLGVRYARAPLREYRFESSIPLHLNESESFDQWPKRCPSFLSEMELEEDCLFFSLLQHNKVEYKATTLLIVTNLRFSESKLIEIVSPTLNVVVASVRDGVLGSLGGFPFSISDVISLSAFLRSYSSILNIGPITVCAMGSIAETISASLSYTDFVRAILLSGNSHTRTIGRGKYASRVLYKLKTELMCDLPSISQSMDCLRSKPLKEILSAAGNVTRAFYPFGDPFRPPARELATTEIPLLLGVYKYLPDRYPTVSNFDESFQYSEFKKFIAGLVPNSMHRNAPLLRRLILHQYIYTKGDKRNNNFLFEQMKKIMLDRDFIVPTHTLTRQLAANNSTVYIIEYESDDLITACLQNERWEETKPFCNRIIQYITQFATRGRLTLTCSSWNLTFPAIEMNVDGTVKCNYTFHQESFELWNNLLPFLDTLELIGRRDKIFYEEDEVDPLDIEDDVQVWHEQSANNELELMKENISSGEERNTEL